MAGDVTITVDTTRANLKLGRVPPQVRDNLRKVIPPLINRLGDSVESKLASELKSRSTLTVTRELHDTTSSISGVAALVSESAAGLLPTYLEKGTVPHVIEGNPILSFYWEKLGAQAFFRKVNHPGTKAYAFMSRTFAEMRDEIVARLEEAAKQGARSA